MSLVSTYLSHLVETVDKWAVYAQDIVDGTSLKTLAKVVGILSSIAVPAVSPSLSSVDLARCPGYQLKHVALTPSSLTATLQLAGKPCHLYGPDIEDLKLLVEYQTGWLLSTYLHPRL